MSRASLTEANAITGKPLAFFRDDYLVVPEKLDSASGHGWN